MITIQQHIDDIEERIAKLTVRGLVLQEKLDALKPIRKELAVIDFEKLDLEAVLNNLKHIRNKEPDKQEVLNPIDPFGDASD